MAAPVLCPVLEVPSGGIITKDNQDHIKLSTYERKVDTTVTVQCLQPNVYEVKGATTLKCTASGAWDQPKPICERIAFDTTPSTNPTVIANAEDNTIILAIVGAILCALLIAVIVILTYLLCKWWNRKSYVTKRIVYDESQMSGNGTPRYDNPSTSFTTYGKTSTLGGANSEYNKSYAGRMHMRRSSDASARTSSTTFSRHSMIVLPKPAYSHHYGPFWYYPIPDDQKLASSAMRSVMDYHEDVTTEADPHPMFDPEVDYLKYPEEETTVDTMGRPVRLRPLVIGGSEAGSSQHNAVYGRNGKGHAGKYKRNGKRDQRGHSGENQDRHDGDDADDGETLAKTGETGSTSGVDNPALQVDGERSGGSAASESDE